MTPRRRAILIVILALLLIAAVIALVLWLLRTRPAAVAPGDATVPAPVVTNAPAPAAPAPAPSPLSPGAPAAAKGSTAAAQMAELFAERYGSYSNQGDFQNLRDLLPVMTDKYRAATEAYLSTAASVPNAPYDGVTSVKISTDVRSYDASAGKAVIAVMLQQQKRSAGSVTPAISYRSLKMSLMKVGADWRVDSAAWEN